jgi:hypothetical protein
VRTILLYQRLDEPRHWLDAQEPESIIKDSSTTPFLKQLTCRLEQTSETVPDLEQLSRRPKSTQNKLALRIKGVVEVEHHSPDPAHQSLRQNTAASYRNIIKPSVHSDDALLGKSRASSMSH